MSRMLFSDTLNLLFPGENWRAHPTESRYVNAAGMSLQDAEIALCDNGAQLKLLLDSKREAATVARLDNALSWVRLPKGQELGTMDRGTVHSDQAPHVPGEYRG